MSQNQCGQCEFFLLFHGEKKGNCYGHPPVNTTSGFQPQQPIVDLNRKACSIFKPLPEGQGPAEKGKVRPQTPAEAVKEHRKSKI
jgi:hypothetical protein